MFKSPKLSTALNYALNHQEVFMYVPLDGRLELFNNKTERVVKSLMMRRKS
ncbi:IS66 family transposase [Lactobacillus crispatus]|uniref:IS66 family transposase n=1 Tax=Lactobacillus crispatus TaxID=47770 RepID=UPI00254C16C8|nr:transposase [Lactobacillus crispatus]MDK7320905.1 transposase [Lactobacillus crispatus]MDK8273187.1 transposase [Lactobacillus crispatus]MDK8569368.1 transposase [Lactobacillus crispatus]